jgi:hypothetical protein
VNVSAEILFALAYEVNGDETHEMDQQLQAVELISQTCKRSRWFLHAALPAIQLYKISLFINTIEQTAMFIENRRETSEVPFLHYTLGDSKFIPIQPKIGFVKIDSGFALIRFAVGINRSRLLIDVINPERKKSRDLAQYVRLVIPGDQSRYEDVIVVSFPEIGKWSVQVFLENDVGSFTSFVTYQFDVIKEIHEIVSPLMCVPEDRSFVPLELPKKMSMTPNESAVVLKNLLIEFKVTFVGNILLNVRQLGKTQTIFPEEVSLITNGEENTGNYQVVVPSPDVYRLLVWLDDEHFEQIYAVGLPRRDVDWVRVKKEEESKPKPQPELVIQPVERSLSKRDQGCSKCCLLL